jgi:ligand-binding sensor domain-containing protein/signal transduction histidine kinase
MKFNHLFFMLVLCIVSSCNNKQENQISKTADLEKQNTFAPSQVTKIANLPDSLQPKIISLHKMPKPITVSAGKGEIKMLPVLQNEKGETILDPDGKPFILGDGGKSNFTHFTTDNGLALDGIRCSVKDNNGNLWFGTNGGGVSRYDGKSFTNFTSAHGLPNNLVYSILEDKSGNFWFGTAGGVSRYDGKSFTNFTTAHGLADNFVNSILEDKSGNLWFSTYGGGVSRYDEKSFTNFTTTQGLVNNDVISILEDKSGNLWFGTSGGVSRYEPPKVGQVGTFISFTTTQGLVNNSVKSILEDKSGNIWFCTNGGVSRYDGKSFFSFTTTKGLANNIVNSILEDNNGNLWFGTDGGVNRYDGKSFISFTTAQGLANNIVIGILEDNNGNLWFCTYEGGISRYDGKSFTSFTTTQGLANNAVMSILEDKSRKLWFGTYDGGVSRFDDKSFTNFTTAQGLVSNSVWSILEDKSGNIWFGTADGVSRYDGKSFTSFTTTQGLVTNSVISIIEDKSGNIWFGTGGGVSRYDGKSFTNFTTAQGLVNNIVYDILEDKSGNLWFGTYGGGVNLYDGKSFTNFTTAQGLANNTVYGILEDKIGNIWFSTAGGVSRILRENLEKSQGNTQIAKGEGTISFNNFTTAQGLANDMVYTIVEDTHGNIVMGTNLGITLIPAKSASLPFSEVEGELEYYNKPNGYPIKDLFRNAMLCDSKGILWAGTGSEKTGLVRFDYSALRKNMVPPKLVIQSIKVKDENICWHCLIEEYVKLDGNATPSIVTEEVGLFGRQLSADERDSMKNRFGNIQFDEITKFYPLPQNLVLPYEHNQLSFEFAAIETGRPFMVKYQYMLDGYDNDWSPITDKSNVTFGNIKEGTYIFKLKARSPEGVWSEPITYAFKVLPPWYRTWWAHSIYSLFLLTIFWRVHLLQKAKTIRIEREKTKDRELVQAKEIEKAYHQLENAHKDLEESHQTLKSTQAQLIQSEKMASLGELTAGIAHEIQNPLNFVNNFSEVSNELIDEVLEERKKEKGERDESLEEEILGDLKQNLSKINQHGKRASDIVKGMLEHSRKSTGEKEITDINALCEEYFRLSYHGLRAKNKDFNASIETNFDPNLPKIDIVPQDIGRVLLNLINNAFYAVNERKNLLGLAGQRSMANLTDLTESSGDANLKDLDYKPKISITTQKTDNNQIKISIKDNGPGIPEAIKDKIFQPFFTTKPNGQGTGLGLSLSYDIVKAHGGELTVDNNKDEGSIFIIELPLTRLTN